MKPFDHVAGDELEIDGARIYYETRGASDGPALVLLHGGLGSLEEFNVILPRLAGDFRIVAIDSRGHGHSTLGTEKLTYERLAEDARRVIAHLGLREVAVVGFSDGGIAAYRMAARKDSGIRRLVTIGARAALRPGVAALFAKITAERWRAKFPDTAELYERVNPTPDFARLVPAVVAMWLDAGATGYPLEQLSAIACPTLILRGDDDHLLTREDAFENARRIRGAKLANLPFAGHTAFLDQTDAFMPGLNRFLSGE